MVQQFMQVQLIIVYSMHLVNVMNNILIDVLHMITYLYSFNILWLILKNAVQLLKNVRKNYITFDPPSKKGIFK
uniref:Uncharacterized protein n=1 Tax=Rhizophagus irregularis (strain DAOM 181602 / DAOM 197198 / MUCL 43194) TaxID=747089 RepID=U9SZR6_RHIID